MAYVDTNSTANRAPAVIGVVAIHAALGVALVTGLAATIVETIETGPIDARNIPIEPPPPPPESEPTSAPQEPASPDVFVPTPPLRLDPRPPEIDTTDILPPPTPAPIPSFAPMPTPSPSIGLPPPPKPTPRFDPIAPKASNNPGAWVTTGDYRSNWIRQELTGTAGFRLQVSAQGRVTGCTITSSTGHAQLDEATCALVTRRARFEPAKDANGKEVAGTFSSAVRWQIPK